MIIYRWVHELRESRSGLQLARLESQDNIHPGIYIFSNTRSWSTDVRYSSGIHTSKMTNPYLLKVAWMNLSPYHRNRTCTSPTLRFSAALNMPDTGFESAHWRSSVSPPLILSQTAIHLARHWEEQEKCKWQESLRLKGYLVLGPTHFTFEPR